MDVSFPGGKKVYVKYKNFIIKTDQPIKYGGENSNPDPFSVFISSIGACVGYFILSFCIERNIQTKDLKIELETKKNDKTNLIEMINIRIITNTHFPDKYLKSMIKVANLCTVKKHLINPPKVNISINNI